MGEIIIDQLIAGYGKQPILRALSAKLPQQTIVGLVAPNGSGKTTLMRLLSGDLSVQSGQVMSDFSSVDVFFLDSQAALLPSFSIRELLTYVQHSFQSKVVVDEVIADLQITRYQNKKLHTLSLGMRQMAMIGIYMVADTPVMLFDEPINGLDQVNMVIVAGILRRLRDQQKIIIVSSHLLDNLVDFVDVFWYLKDGQIVQQVPNNGQVAQVKQLYLDLYRGGEYE